MKSVTLSRPGMAALLLWSCSCLPTSCLPT
jgi:hypothetical protein